MPFCLVILLISATVYEREVVVSNPTDSLQTDVQVMLTLDTRSLIEAGKLDLEGNAIRFFRRVQHLSYWVADGIHTCSTRIWLRLDSLFPEESKLTLLYSSSTDGYEPSFDSVFTKAGFDSAWVFHCDEGEGDFTVTATGSETLILEEVDWSPHDGGGWGKREDQRFSTGSALHFEPGSFAQWDMPAEACRDSFTIALWLRLDTLDYLTYSSELRILAERPDVFLLWLRQGNLGFSLQGASHPKTCYLPPFGWERVGTPEIPAGFVPQGLSAMGEKLLFSAYSKAPPVSRVWRIAPSNLELLDWFDMPAEASHTSGLAYDSTRGVLWAADYDSDKLYAIDADSSFATQQAVILGDFPMGVEGVSACCFAPFYDTLRLIVSTYTQTAKTYVVDEQASLAEDRAVILGSYKNTVSSQGLAFDGQHLWESSNWTLAQYNLEEAVQAGSYSAGVVSYWPEPYLVEDLAFMNDTLWTSSEARGKAFYRLTGDPHESLGRWMHLAATYDGKKARFYCNAEAMDSAWTGSPTTDWQASPLFIGGRDDGKVSFEGTIDEIVILPRVLDTNKIRALFERRKSLVAEPTFQVGEENTLSNRDVINKLSNLRGIELSSSAFVFFLPYECDLSINLFDVCGRRVATLLTPQKIRGKVELRWPHNIPAGVYYLFVSYDGEAFSRKVVLLR